MSHSTDPIADPERLATLREVDLLDTPPEEAFDRLTCLAARLLDARVALIALVDRNRQFFKSCVGDVPEPWRAQREAPLAFSFCQHVVATGEPFLVEDARDHPLVQDSPLIRDLDAITYAGVPLAMPGGQVIGTLSVLASEPRRWSPEQVEILRSLAALAVCMIAYRSVMHARRAAGQEEQRTPPPVRPGAKLSVQVAEMLADAASEYLRCLDVYDRVLREFEPSPEALASEAEHRALVLDAERDLERAAQQFGARLETWGGEPDDPTLRSAAALWRACVEYIDERETLLAPEEERAVRKALRTYRRQAVNSGASVPSDAVPAASSRSIAGARSRPRPAPGPVARFAGAMSRLKSYLGLSGHFGSR